MKPTLIIFLLGLSFGIQTNVSAAYMTDPPISLEIVEKDFPLYRDSDFQIIYLDFEQLTANIKSLRIVNEKGNVVFTDDVSDVAIDDIYEINYSDFNAGKYRLELFTYAGSILNSDFVIEK